MATATNNRVFKAGRVLAPDSKWTGEEPVWTGWEQWSTEKFYKTRSRMLNFYGYYLSQPDLKPAVLVWMKSNGYSKSDIDLIKTASPGVLPATVGKLIRAMDQGMPSLHPLADLHFAGMPFSDPENPPIPKCDRETVVSEINKTLSFLKSVVVSIDLPSDEIKPDVARFKGIYDKLKERANNEVIVHLDKMLDSWITAGKNPKVDGISLTSFVRDSGLPANATKYILEWLERQREEFNGALEKTCPDLEEGYSYLSKPALRSRIAALDTMIGEVNKIKAIAKANRKPVVKKPKDAGKQVARLQFQSNSVEFGIDSISPVRIPTSHRLFLFNTKTKTLTVLFSKGTGGFAVSGSSIKNFDEKTSFTLKVRKSKDLLDKVAMGTIRQVEKYIEALISANVAKQTFIESCRCNAATLIVRVIETRH